MMKKIEQQLKKGLLEIGILSLLDEQDSYGYEVISLLDRSSKGVFKLKEGTLYPILYRLEDHQLIESYWQALDDTRQKPRKYYKITHKGRQVLLESEKKFFEIFDGMSCVLKRNER